MFFNLCYALDLFWDNALRYMKLYDTAISAVNFLLIYYLSNLLNK